MLMQLTHVTNSLLFVWWALQGSNLQPAGYEPASLPIEIKARLVPNPNCTGAALARGQAFTGCPIYT